MPLFLIPDFIFLDLSCLTYCAKSHQGKEEILDVSCRKRKVLHLVSQWTSLYKDWLHGDEHLKQFLKVCLSTWILVEYNENMEHDGFFFDNPLPKAFLTKMNRKWLTVCFYCFLKGLLQPETKITCSLKWLIDPLLRLLGIWFAILGPLFFRVYRWPGNYMGKGPRLHFPHSWLCGGHLYASCYSVIGDEGFPRVPIISLLL